MIPAGFDISHDLGDSSLLAERAGVTRQTQADSDPDSAQALAQLTQYGNAALNELLEPSGTGITNDEYALLSGPVLARIFFEREPVTDEFIAAVVAQWLAGRAYDR